MVTTIPGVHVDGGLLDLGTATAEDGYDSEVRSVGHQFVEKRRPRARSNVVRSR